MNKLYRFALILTLQTALWASGANYQMARAASAEHTAAVKTAQRSAYAIRSATNGCPLLRSSFEGWPADMLRECEYKQGNLTGVTYLLDLKPAMIADWIESSCAESLRGVSSCFATVLECGKLNSGLMFAVSGNIIENGKNYFFRNGMTVGFPHVLNGEPNQIPIDKQRELVVASGEKIERIRSGVTRPWRTFSQQFAVAYPDAGAPARVDTHERRMAWLGLVQTETLQAMKTGKSRILSAWIKAHPKTIAAGNCPLDDQP